MEASGSPSLVLVEQHEALRDGLAVLLERRGFEVRRSPGARTRTEAVVKALERGEIQRSVSGGRLASS